MENAKILIVEDDKTVARLMQTVLTKNGYPVCAVAATGEEAIEAALKGDPDLILMNIKLKGKINGITACEEIRKSSDVPIIFVSGYADTDIRARALQNKVSGYLIKPFKNAAFLRIVANTLLDAKRSTPVD